MQCFFEKLAKATSVFFLSLATILVVFNVTARYVFNYGVPWCEEAIRYSVIFATFFGLSLAVATNQSIKIDVLLQLTRGKFRYCVNLLGVILESATLLILVFLSVLLVIETYETGQITPSTDYPMYIPYIMLAAGVVTCAVRSLQEIRDALRGGDE